VEKNEPRTPRGVERRKPGFAAKADLVHTVAMLCENCQKSVATVHLSGWQTTRTGSDGEQREERIEHHYCEECAEELRQSNPLLNPLLKADSGARTLKLQVVSVSPDRVEVRAISPESDFTQKQRGFLKSRFPSQYAVQGMEFEMIVTDAQLKWLQGEE
jgi:hypothetical protein